MHDLVRLVAILVAVIRAATPLVLAGCGELIAERSGVLNLGVEGMMLVGSVAGFVAASASGNPLLGLLAAMVAGMLLALVFAVLTLSLRANQVATGLALTIFGVGFSALVGKPFVGVPITGLATIVSPGLAQDSPLLQQLLLVDPLAIFALLLPFALALFLHRTRRGLILR